MRERPNEVGRQPVDEAVDIRRLDKRRVVLEADRHALVIDADEPVEKQQAVVRDLVASRINLKEYQPRKEKRA